MEVYPDQKLQVTKQNVIEEDEDDEYYLVCGCKLPIRWHQLIVLCAWLVAAGYMAFYIIKQTNSYKATQGKPTTSLKFEERIPLAFPAVTICNWNTGALCDLCNLGFIGAFSVADDKIATLSSDQAYFKQISQQDMDFNCWVFNNVSESNLLNSEKTGYSGSYSFYMKVPKPTDADILAGLKKIGLQVSFHPPGTVPDLVAETNYAMPGIDNFFMLTKIVNTRLRVTVDFPNLTEERWEASHSSIKMYGLENSDKDYYLTSISVTYATLNVNHIDEVETSTLAGLLGDIAGMLGTTMGIDVLKAVRGILDIPYIFIDRSLVDFYNTFN